jgi:hypothetical protein
MIIHQPPRTESPTPIPFGREALVALFRESYPQAGVIHSGKGSMFYCSRFLFKK